MTDQKHPILGGEHWHCWHATSLFSNGFEDTENETCCHCGFSRVVKYRNVDDPDHGRYVRVTIRQKVNE